MVALSLWKLVCCRDFVIPMDGSLVIMEGSLLSRFFSLQWMVALLLWKVVLLIFLLLQWMVALSLWKVVICRDFVIPMDGNLVIMEGSILSRFCYSNGW